MFFLNQYVGIKISNSFEVISHMELTAGKFFIKFSQRCYAWLLIQNWFMPKKGIIWD